MKQLSSNINDEFDDEFDFSDLIYVLTKFKYRIATVALVVAIVSVGLSFLITKQYTASITLLPTSMNSDSISGKYGDLAGMVGISMPGEEGNITQEALAIIKSRKFIHEFIDEHDIKHKLFYKQWDTGKEIWVEKFNPVAFVFGENESVSYPGKRVLLPGEPANWKVYELFTSVMNIQEFDENGIVEISIQLTDPVLAGEIANQLVEDINNNLREESIRKSRETITFLDNKLQEARVIELKEAISTLLKENMQKLSLANIERDFVFKVIDPAIVPEIKSAPKRLIWALLGFLTGFIISFVWYFRKNSALSL